MEKNVSIIVPAYKSQDYLMECISSIYEQEFENDIEILIGIDGCTDTLNLVENNLNFFSGTSVYYFEENLGPYVIKNNLIGLAKYEMVIFFDSDDIMLPNLIKTFFKYIKEYSIIRFRFRNFCNENNTFGKDEEWAWGVFGLSKQTFENVGYFQNWVCSADYEFISRANFMGSGSKGTFDITFHRRIHNESLTNKTSTNFSSEIRKKYQSTVVSNIENKVWEKPEFKKVEFKKIN